MVFCVNMCAHKLFSFSLFPPPLFSSLLPLPPFQLVQSMLTGRLIQVVTNNNKQIHSNDTEWNVVAW